MQPQAQGGGGKGKGGAASAGGGAGAGGGRPTAAATVAVGSSPPPVLGVLALSMLLQPADAEAAVARHLPPELVPRLLLDTTRLLPGAVVRGASGVAYVEPCVMFLRVRLISATGLGRGGREGAPSRSSTPGHLQPHHHHHHTPHHHHHHCPHGGGEGGGRGPLTALPGQIQELGAKLQAHVDRTMGHVGAFISRLKEQRGGKNRGLAATAAAAMAAAAGQRTQSVTVAVPPPPPTAAAGGKPRRKSMEEVQSHQIRTSNNGSASGGGGWEAGVDHAAAETVMSLLESNGFAVVDNRRLSNYFWCKVSYEGQYHTSRLVPVAGGAVRWDETFVLAALRPARTALLEIELYGSNDSKSRGKVVCQLSVPLCDLMEQVLRNHHDRVSEQENQRKEQLHREEQQELLQELNYRQRHYRRSRFGFWRGVRAVRSAFSSVAARAAAATGASGGGAATAARLPPYHPETWPRGRAVLTARIGGPGGHASATHGSPVGPDGGARECTFHFEVEVVDADTRAAANDTQILPWSTTSQRQFHHHLQRPQGGPPAAATYADSDYAADSATPYDGVMATRQGSTGSMIIAAAVGGASNGGGAILSPPWSPLSRAAGDVLTPAGTAPSGILSLGSVVAACFVHEASAPVVRQPLTETVEAAATTPLLINRAPGLT
ncbi:hypothetical protein Vretimale_6670 [Volvox reticuliferus]|uniref:C2 domain-containing protein n=1 Tax=Volvox reticuliferus TaxID=1737510 RepID=A0A8J4G7V9_9CHLO|nr:hypothetical protein Vretimale_6670 [Volvox reticuliferus]